MAASYHHEEAGEYVFTKTIPGMLAQRATEIPDDEAYVFRKESGRVALTFRELDEKSTRVAAALLRAGFSPGDRVALMGPACAEWVLVDYAALKVNVITVRMSMDFDTKDSLLGILNNYNCVGFVFHPGTDDKVMDKVKVMFPSMVSGSAEKMRGGGLTSLKVVLTMSASSVPEVKSITEMSEYSPTDDERRRIDDIMAAMKPSDVASTFTTSGSTGQPKLASVTHITALKFHDLFRKNGLKAGERMFSDRAFAWIGSGHFGPVSAGCCYVHVTAGSLYNSERDFAFQCMREENVTQPIMLPYLIHDAIDLAESHGNPLPTTLKCVYTGGERPSEDMVRRALKIIPKAVIIYGATEACLAMYENLQSFFETGSYGQICPDREMKIAADNGEAVVRGEVGEICTRSPGTFFDYMDDEEATRAVRAPDGWVHTRDMGVMTSEGRIKILGRKAEVISRGIRKLFPAVLEKVLVMCPKVEKCCVIGVPDPRLYEEVCACVVPVAGSNLTEAEMAAAIESQIVDVEDTVFRFKYLLMMDSLPLNNNGKIDRRATKEIALQRLNLTLE